MANTNEFIPSGLISAWYGFSYAIPSGWHLCDGTNGTPDLKGKFILGTDNLVGQYGGEAVHTLTVNEIPSHNHGYVKPAPQSVVGNINGHNAGGEWSSTNNTGGNQPHNNMPPYCTLLYIMKL